MPRARQYLEQQNFIDGYRAVRSGAYLPLGRLPKTPVSDALHGL